MKNDLVTSIAIAIMGIIISFVVCNLLTGTIETVSIKTVDSSFNTDIAEPNPELFNYKAINPTVEVYVGNNSAQNQSDLPSDQGTN